MTKDEKGDIALGRAMDLADDLKPSWGEVLVLPKGRTKATLLMAVGGLDGGPRRPWALLTFSAGGMRKIEMLTTVPGEVTVVMRNLLRHYWKEPI